MFKNLFPLLMSLWMSYTTHIEQKLMV